MGGKSPPDGPIDTRRGRLQPELDNDANLLGHERGNEKARATLAYLAAGILVFATLIYWLVVR
jgi:hypothetical protein